MSNLNANSLPSPPEGKAGWPWTEGSAPSETRPESRVWPKISIVTPSFNQGRFIETTLRSVLLQGYPNLEYIVMDGGSTDRSVEIIRRYSPWLQYWVSQRDRGQSDAINQGFGRATGEIYAWLNSDDILLPGALDRVAEACSEAPEAVAWVGDCFWVTPDLRVTNRIEPKGLDRQHLGDWWFSGFLMQPSCFFRASGWKKAGGLDETLHYAMDLDLWLKLVSTGSFKRVPAVLSAAVIHQAAKTQAAIPQMQAETAYVQFKHGYREAATNRLVEVLSRSSGGTGTSKGIRGALRRYVRPMVSLIRGNRIAEHPTLSEVLSEQSIDGSCS
jgi:GT2 family glycosyltransferase